MSLADTISRERPVAPVPRGEDVGLMAVTLAKAFQDDPALAWIIPNADRRWRVLPSFFVVMIEQSFRHGEVLASPDRQAVSLWYPPGEVRDGVLASSWDNLRMVSVFKSALPRGLKVAEAMHACHPEPQPFAYLRYVGVAPEGQGKGWGGALVRAGISRAAEQGQGVLLETATASNVAIYSRLGFAIREQWRVPRQGPDFWTMERPPNTPRSD